MVVKKRKQGRICASELMRRLERDPKHLERERQRKDKEARIREAVEREMHPVLEDLAHIGIDVGSREELLASHSPLQPEVVDILLRRLPEIEDERAKEMLVRALGAAAEPFDGTCLIDLFEKDRTENLRWVIANTMALALPHGVTNWLVGAVEQRKYGTSRQMLILALARLGDREVTLPVLRRVFDAYPGHVAMALGEIGREAEAGFLESRTDGLTGWEGKEAVKAIDKIRRRVARRSGR